MVEAKVQIKNETGLHARPASKFIAFVSQYDCNVSLVKDDKVANAKSILNVLTLALNKGAEVTVRVDGNNEAQALKEIVDFIENLKD